MREMRDSYRIGVGKPEGRRLRGRLWPSKGIIIDKI
jgi:hypothetical protein